MNDNTVVVDVVAMAMIRLYNIISSSRPFQRNDDDDGSPSWSEINELLHQNLHLALKWNHHCGSVDVIQLLIQNYPESVRCQTLKRGKWPLHYVRYDHADAEHTLRLVQVLVTAWPDAVRTPNDEGFLPLHFACSYYYYYYSGGGGTTTTTNTTTTSSSSINVIAYLIDCWPESVQVAATSGGPLPLHLACSNAAAARDVSLIRMLVQAWPDSVRVPDGENGNLPLHRACYHSQQQSSTSTDTADADDTDETNVILLFLMQCWPESLQVRNQWGFLPLHIACRYQTSVWVIRHVMDMYPPAVLMQDIYSRVPLHYCFNRHPALPFAVIEYLLQVGPDAVRVPDQKGLLPLHCALGDKKCTLEIIQVLVNAWPESLQVRDHQGQLPLHWACRYQISSRVIRYVLDRYPSAARVPDRNGHLPLHYACARRPALPRVVMEHDLIPAWPESCRVHCPYTNQYEGEFIL